MNAVADDDGIETLSLLAMPHRRARIGGTLVSIAASFMGGDLE